MFALLRNQTSQFTKLQSKLESVPYVSTLIKLDKIDHYAESYEPVEEGQTCTPTFRCVALHLESPRENQSILSSQLTIVTRFLCIG